MTLSLCLGHKGRCVSACGLLSVYPQVRICCFSKLKGQSIGITHYYTKKKKKSWKNPHQFLLCFLNFINLVWPVLKHCWRCFVYKDWKNKKAERVLAFENSSLEGAHLCCFLRDYFWKAFVTFLHSFSFSCHLKSSFLFLMLILKFSFGFFSVSLESSDILITFVHQGQLCCKGMCLKSLSERPFHLIQN